MSEATEALSPSARRVGGECLPLGRDQVEESEDPVGPEGPG